MEGWTSRVLAPGVESSRVITIQLLGSVVCLTLLAVSSQLSRPVASFPSELPRLDVLFHNRRFQMQNAPSNQSTSLQKFQIKVQDVNAVTTSHTIALYSSGAQSPEMDTQVLTADTPPSDMDTQDPKMDTQNQKTEFRGERKDTAADQNARIPAATATSGPTAPAAPSRNESQNQIARITASVAQQSSGVHTEEIPGTKLKDATSLRNFLKRWDCLTSLNTSMWTRDPNPRIIPWGGNYQCPGRKGYRDLESNKNVLSGKYTATDWPVDESLKYVWGPKTPGACDGSDNAIPSFATFDGTGFCKTMRRRGGSLFIVGDSLSFHFYKSFISEMISTGTFVSPMKTVRCRAHSDQVNKSGAQTWIKRPPCAGHMTCAPSIQQGGVPVHFVVSNKLERVYKNDPVEDNSTEFPMGEDMVDQNASVVIMNRGAHFVDLNKYSTQLNRSLQELRKLLPKTLLVFRSTSPGHPNCSRHTRPIDSPLDLENAPYNWDKFQKTNSLAKQLIQEMKGVYLDIYPMSSLRPDLHNGKDCLHFCMPGPVNFWIRMFIQMVTDLS